MNRDRLAEQVKSKRENPAFFSAFSAASAVH
jgi:hypothetical protein